MGQNKFNLYILKDEETAYKTYTYIVVFQPTKVAVIIDPACGEKKLESLITRLALKIQWVLLTHVHHDHIRQVDWLIRNFNIKVGVGADEAYFYDYYVPNMEILHDQQQVQITDNLITCLCTPGHTKGSMCYLIEDKLFTGDTVFIEGCGICSEIGGSPYEMFDSIQRLKQIIPEITEIYPGHCYVALPGKTMKYLYENNIYFMLDEKESFVNFRMRKNQKDLFNFK